MTKFVRLDNIRSRPGWAQFFRHACHAPWRFGSRPFLSGKAYMELQFAMYCTRLSKREREFETSEMWCLTNIQQLLGRWPSASSEEFFGRGTRWRIDDIVLCHRIGNQQETCTNFGSLKKLAVVVLALRTCIRHVRLWFLAGNRTTQNSVQWRPGSATTQHT